MSKAKHSEMDRWHFALDYFRLRGGVLFLSYCRFWERHGFVQQSLAHRLAAEGIEVRWLDGAGWRPYQPIVSGGSRRLHVEQLPSLPLRRLPLVATWDRFYQTRFIRRAMKDLGGNPVVWVQAGLDEGVVSRLPYVDVFSVFDDPYRHPPTGALANKARVIVCQNEKARSVLAPIHGKKTQVLLPPMDMSESSLHHTAEVFFQPDFPTRIMGYVGSFFSDGFDLELFEKFIQAMPDWGFVMMGRTDANGLAVMRKWKEAYSNFHFVPWVPRHRVGAVWKRISVSLLLYRPCATQDGAFPVKVLEGLRFGVPAIATEVPKTEGLEGFFPRSNDANELLAHARAALERSPEELKSLYIRFKKEMDPVRHLALVGEWLGAGPRGGAPPTPKP